jgi:hypothetical protein
LESNALHLGIDPAILAASVLEQLISEPRNIASKVRSFPLRQLVAGRSDTISRVGITMASPANAPGPMLKAILLLTMIEPPLVANGN